MIIAIISLNNIYKHLMNIAIAIDTLIPLLIDTPFWIHDMTHGPHTCTPVERTWPTWVVACWEYTVTSIPLDNHLI